MSARYLAIDTSTEACSAALWTDGDVLERYEVAGREHTQRLFPMIQSLLSEAQLASAMLDAVVCGVGPGSFAGVRIGVGVAKGLALAYDRPVVGVSSLAMLALGALRGKSAGQAAAVIDARMQQVYCGLYRPTGGGVELIGAERVCSPGDVPRLGTGVWHGAGTGWGTYPDELREAFAADEISFDAAALPRAAAAMELAIPILQAGKGVSADELVPVYLRDRVALTLAEQRARAG